MRDSADSAAGFCFALLALGLCAPALASKPAPPTFSLVSYYAAGDALESEVLDTGLSADDCAFAFERVGPMVAPEILVTCEPEQ